MKAIGFNSKDTDPVLFEQPTPKPSGRDVLVAIEAVAVNPVDIKIKDTISGTLDTPKIVGWDAKGTIIAIGEQVELFSIGDSVYYAGDVTRMGCHATHQLVDERIIGTAPKTLSAAECAAMPLTSITAWEALFSRLKITADNDANKTILIIGGAGGVGSIAIQLAKKLLNLTVITTASRSSSEQWCLEMGADHVINHHGDMAIQYRALGLTDPDYILCLNDTDRYFTAMSELIAPQGMICSIVGSQQKHNLDLLKSKSAGFVWEFMFTRPMFKTRDLIQQHHILNHIAELVDNGQIRCTLSEIIGPLSVSTLKTAHEKLLSGSTIGKLALTTIVS